VSIAVGSQGMDLVQLENELTIKTEDIILFKFKRQLTNLVMATSYLIK